MKKIFTLACIGLFVTACMNKPKTQNAQSQITPSDTTKTELKTDTATMAQTAPAYVGTFEGDLPTGKETVMLTADMTYKVIDKSGAIKEGNFTIKGDTITLKVGNREEYYLFHGVALERLDRDRKPHKDAAKYMLKKQSRQ